MFCFLVFILNAVFKHGIWNIFQIVYIYVTFDPFYKYELSQTSTNFLFGISSSWAKHKNNKIIMDLIPITYEKKCHRTWTKHVFSVLCRRISHIHSSLIFWFFFFVLLPKNSSRFMSPIHNLGNKQIHITVCV